MFTQSAQRIGFACKYLHPDQSLPKKQLEEIQRSRTEKCTTVAWLNRQTRDDAEQRLWDIMVHNAQSAYNLVEYVGGLPEGRKMVRIGSNQLPMYTQDEWKYFWRKPDVREYCETHYARVGDLARQLDVRLSFHPGQFCVLASDNPDIVERSIEEFEYHTDLIRWMGFGKQFQDFKCNVHISGKQGPEGIRKAYKRLSPEARNTITIENEENAHGLDTCLELADLLPIVLDIHHHWCREGEYIQPNDDRVQRVLDSWRGVRPTMHYSYSRNEHLPAQVDGLPQMNILLESGHKKQKLRAHSDFYPNSEANAWALSFHDNFDIMCEAKAKNLASQQVYEQSLVR